MSLDKHRTGDKPNPYTMGEGRREESGQQSESPQRSGGVGVDGTSASSVKVSWENSGGGPQAQPPVQAGRTSQAGGAAGEVGVPHSSVDLLHFKRSREPRGDTCSTRRGEAKDAGMAGATRIATPEKVRQLQITLYRKAKAEPKYRFWSLYGDLLILIRFQDEPNSGRVSAWQDHAGLIHSLLSGRN